LYLQDTRYYLEDSILHNTVQPALQREFESFMMSGNWCSSLSYQMTAVHCTRGKIM